tara:strand:- start:30 stop:845 length:816 start_codon:yes stop_codon:yes gene_type:complete
LTNQITKIIDNVKNFGVTNYHKWLEDQDLKVSRKIVGDINCVKGNYKGIFEKDKVKWVDFFLKFRFKKLKYHNYFYNLSNKLGMKKIADGIFDVETKLARVDCYVSPKSDEPVLDWHFDHAYSGSENVNQYEHPESETIKFFFYLTDVSLNNGCLGYIPKSHIIAFALKKGIYEDKIKYTPYWTLSDFRKTILMTENYAYIRQNVDPNILNEFLEKTEPSIFKSGSDLKYNFQRIKAGGATIFNDSGAHKGSKIQFTERLVMRFFFRKISW